VRQIHAHIRRRTSRLTSETHTGDEEGLRWNQMGSPEEQEEELVLVTGQSLGTRDEVGLRGNARVHLTELDV
jgi:hypothetical protein